MKRELLTCAVLLVMGCEGASPSVAPSADTAPPKAPGSAAPSASAAPKGPSIDPAKVEAATGIKPEVSEGVVKVSYPRGDAKVEVDGWAMPPFMGLTSWAAFTRGEKPGVEAMVMGDLVLLEDEVSDVMSALLGNGIAVTALHNHFFFDKPHVFFMHIEGEGAVEPLGAGVKRALDAMKAVRAASPHPKDRFDGRAFPAKSAIDPAMIEGVFGVKGAVKEGMVKVTIGRTAAITAACGCKVGKAMGVSTWAAFAGTDESAVVDGDVAVTEDELQPVLKALRAEGIHVVAIHHHMTGEEPRILFVHYWGRGGAKALAASVKKAVSLTKTDAPPAAK